MAFCGNCGATQPDNIAFCANCGAPLQQPAQPHQPMDTQPQQVMYVKPKIPGRGFGISGMVLGIIGLLVWIIPLFSIPVPVIGFTLSYNRNYKLGIILNSIGMGLSLMWTILCVLSEME